MVILGIDPGSVLIGYGAIETENRKLNCLTYGVLRVNEKEEALRLIEVKQLMEKLINDIKPSLVVLEKLFFFKNRRTVMQVSQTRGVIILTLAEKQIPFIEVAPLELKKAITSFGRATKGSMQKMVKIILNLKEDPKPDDAADALALAILGCKV